MKKRAFRVLAVASLVTALSLFAGGCAKQKVQADKEMAAPAPVVSTAPAPAPVQRADVGEGMGQEESLASTGWAGGDIGAVLEGRTTAPMLPVYFDYDKFDIRADQQGRLRKNADLLNASPQVRVRVEGNTDERGTNEYNMALGERRATSARKYLVNLGVAEGRIDAISYGEERPLALGQTEEAWAMNRRADFVVIR